MSLKEIDLSRLKADVTLTQGDWLKAPESNAVMAALNVDPPRWQALYVGGCVRDAILGRTVTDTDIATTYTPRETIDLLEKSGIKAVPTGIAYGTITAVCGAKTFQITSLRKDVETFGRRAVVAFTKDWHDDAARRDFTMNTLLADGDGAVYDPLGQGVRDLMAGHVRFVGDPETRIAEDYLRILRFFRFVGSHGKAPADKAALKACRKLADHIHDLSRERITQEYTRILAGDRAADILAMMLDCKVLPELVHKDYDRTALERLIALENRFGVANALNRFLVLAHADADHLTFLEKRLIFSRREQGILGHTLKALHNLNEASEKDIKVIVYRDDNDIAVRALLLHAAIHDGVVPPDLFKIASEWKAPRMPLSGLDLHQLGVEQGRQLGVVLEMVENWWIGENFLPDYTACRAFAEQMIFGTC